MGDWLDSSDAVAEQYADAENLNARITLHEAYSTADRDFRSWQFDQFDCDSDARLLAVGCGPAELWEANADRVPENCSVTLTDFSPGMVEEARENVPSQSATFSFRVADASDLPFEDDSFDVMTANHMLYHVPNRAAAIRELRRVLKPDGVLYATTNGDHHLGELFDVIETVLDVPTSHSTGFTLENGREQLERQFSDVEIRNYDDSLAVTAVEPLVAYALSRNDVDDSAVDELHEAFQKRFEDGVFHVSKNTGLFVASG
ncbi:class I SAM-dependent methyltransferase [Haladaptatus sp. DFWS20]|uniref:class I SAM-dependent methyltransferase n=1 Tax=Haladaptatus sp. DFWS20 TaxID=3403467 RepID=UPI003EB82112